MENIKDIDIKFLDKNELRKSITEKRTNFNGRCVAGPSQDIYATKELIDSFNMEHCKGKERLLKIKELASKSSYSNPINYKTTTIPKINVPKINYDKINNEFNKIDNNILDTLGFANNDDENFDHIKTFEIDD